MKRFSKFFLLISTAIVFFVSGTSFAQIKNIYDAPNNDGTGVNSLMSAVVSGDVDGVKFFSKAGGALINQKNVGGATALHLSCREGNADMVRILTDNGANVDVVDNEGWTPLMRAALAGNKASVVILLVKGARADIFNSVGESAIIHAVNADCSDCLSVMFEKFNFVKFMDINLLKGQLADAFVIARNRGNQIEQDMISAYLDRVAQLAPMIEKEKAEKAAAAAKLAAEEAAKLKALQDQQAAQQAAEQAQTTIIIDSPALQKGNKGKKFVFKKQKSEPRSEVQEIVPTHALSKSENFKQQELLPTPAPAPIAQPQPEIKTETKPKKVKKSSEPLSHFFLKKGEGGKVVAKVEEVKSAEVTTPVVVKEESVPVIAKEEPVVATKPVSAAKTYHFKSGEVGKSLKQQKKAEIEAEIEIKKSEELVVEDVTNFTPSAVEMPSPAATNSGQKKYILKSGSPK
ncbi:MAG: hypothetical protein FJX34_03170 [Alphaproteobacteria bacterium]|nr:hypothetical protein [Alphaproteobacteria bacterium]